PFILNVRFLFGRMTFIHLNICGITSEIKLSGTNNCYNEIRKRYQKFLCSSNKHRPNLRISLKTIRLHRNNLPDEVPLINECNNTLRIKGRGFDCRISDKNGYWNGNGIVDDNIYQFDSLLRLLWSQILLLNDGFLIHSFGANFNNKGYLFPGPSGSGKTTLAKKAPYSDVLSDEVVGMRIIKGQPYLMGTPFWGEFQKGGQPVCCPLCGIYFLKKNKPVGLKPLITTLVTKKLLKLVLFFGNQSVSGGSNKSMVINSVQKLLNVIDRYLTKIPAYQINLAKNTRYETIMKMITRNKCY
ncbi:MAG: hypothetical protein V1709_10515, partial [Planctomycetota bacterium]